MEERRFHSHFPNTHLHTHTHPYTHTHTHRYYSPVPIKLSAIMSSVVEYFMTPSSPGLSGPCRRRERGKEGG